jgi:hypothetical protein
MCTFTADDVSMALSELDAAVAAVDPARINTFYWVWGSWSLDPDEEAVLESFLNGVDARVARGEVAWTSVGGMIDAHDQWVLAGPHVKSADVRLTAKGTK